MLRIHRMPQRSDAWWKLRIGKITGTNFATMANGKSATVEVLCLKKATEIITGKSCEDNYTNAAMEAGIELEEDARRAYETSEFVHVEQVGFIELDEYIGISPDGLVGDDGCLEIKCPQPHTHLSYLLAGGNAWKGYKWQNQGLIRAAVRKWCHFVSYCPVFPADKQLLIERVLPDKVAFEKLDAGAAYCRKRIAELVKGFADAKSTLLL